MNLNTKQQNVLEVIKRFPESVNDDAKLISSYWVLFDNWTGGTDLSKCTRPETITRRRRELYNMGLISYSDESDKRREEAYANEKERSAEMATKYAAVSWLDDSEDCES